MPKFDSFAVEAIALPGRLLNPVIVEIQGEESINELFQFQLRVTADIASEPRFGEILGREVVVRFGTEESERFIHGVVSQVAETARVPDLGYLIIELTVVPAVWALTQGCRRRVFQDQSVRQILETVFGQFDVAFDLARSYFPRLLCVQYDESDFDFAVRLMRDEGIHFTFRHTRSGHQLVVSDGSARRASTAEQSPRIYCPKSVADRMRQASIFRWTRSQQMGPTRFLDADYHFEMPKSRIESHLTLGTSWDESARYDIATIDRLVAGVDSSPVVQQPVSGVGKFFDTVGTGGEPRNTSAEFLFELARRRVRDRSEAALGKQLSSSGESDLPVTAGEMIQLQQHPSADGSYLVTRAWHYWRGNDRRAPNWDQEGTFAATPHEINRYTCKFDVLPASVEFRSSRALSPRVRAELETAVVVGPGDEEIFTDKHGRVKIRFHWDTSSEGIAGSCWVRVAQAWSGKNYGSFSLPRVGSEVIVDFVHGDPDQPMIVGSVYNAENRVPFETPNDRTVTGLKTRSYRGDTADFHGMVFDDRKGEESIRFRSQRDVLLEAKNSVVVAAPRGLTHRSHGFQLQIAGGFGSDAASGMGSGVGGDGGIAAEHLSPGSLPNSVSESLPKGFGRQKDWSKIAALTSCPTDPFTFSISSSLGVNNEIAVGFHRQCDLFSSTSIKIDPQNSWTSNHRSTTAFAPCQIAPGGNNLLTDGPSTELRYGTRLRAERGTVLNVTASMDDLEKSLAGIQQDLVLSAALLPHMKPFPDADDYSSFSATGTNAMLTAVQALLTYFERLKLTMTEQVMLLAQAGGNLKQLASNDKLVHLLPAIPNLMQQNHSAMAAIDSLNEILDNKERTTKPSIEASEGDLIRSSRGGTVRLAGNQGVTLAGGDGERCFLSVGPENLSTWADDLTAVTNRFSAVAGGEAGLFLGEASAVRRGAVKAFVHAEGEAINIVRQAMQKASIQMTDDGIVVEWSKLSGETHRVILSDDGIELSAGGTSRLFLDRDQITLDANKICCSARAKINFGASMVDVGQFA